MKKLLSLTLALVLLLTSMSMVTFPAAAGETPTVSTGDYLVNPGDTIDVPIVVSNNPGIVSLAFKIGYDSDVLELVGKTNGDFDGDYSFSRNLSVNPYKIYWMNALTLQDITNEGVFMTLTFKVKENARPGASTTFTYEYDQADICNFDFEDVVFDFIGGTVTVDGGSGDEEVGYTNPTIATDNYTVWPGETFDVPITVYNNPGIVSLAFKIGYDSSVLELVGKQNGEFDGDYSFGPNFQQNPYKINWMNALATEDITTNGTLVTLTFKVKEDAAPGASTTFTYSYNQADIYNFDFEDVVFDFISGTVGPGPHCHHEYDDCEDTTCNYCGMVRVAPGHVYDDEYDADCNVCGRIGPCGHGPCVKHEYMDEFDPYCWACGCGHIREVPELPENDPYVAIGSYEVFPGETFDVPIYVGNNPGIVSLAFKLGYDSDVLELVGKTNGEFDGDYSFGPNFQQNPYKINWMNALAAEDITTNGTLVTLTFKVKENARPGASTTFTYSHNPADIYNFDFEDVVFDFIGGTVEVVGDFDDEEVEYTNPTIVTDNYTVRPGKEFDVPITVYNNPGIVSLAFKIGYDSSVLELVGKTNGEFDGDYSFGHTLAVNPYKINWMNALSTEDITTNGTLVTLTFKVKEDAAPGASTTFTYSYNQADICNFDFEDVVFDFVGGTVMVWPCDHSYSAVCDPTCNLCGETRPVTHTYTNMCDTICNLCGDYRSVPHDYNNDCDATCNWCGHIRTPNPHKYTNVCDTTCNVCGSTRTVPHVYSDVCDEICNVCYYTRTVPHVYTNVCDEICNVCNHTRTVPHVYSHVCDKVCNVCSYTRTVPHDYDHSCDPDCNFCGETRPVSHTYDHVCDEVCNVCFYKRTVPHDYDHGCDPDCNLCGKIRPVSHEYDHDCDPDCNICGKIRPISHKYDYDCDPYCNVCGYARSISHYYVDGTCPSCGGICTSPTNGAYITTGDHVVKAGQTFKVTINVGNNPGIVSTAFKIGYDSDIVELIGKTNGEFEGEYSFSPDLTVNPYKINWMNALITEDITANGTFMTLTFKVKEDAQAGSAFNFSYTYQPMDIFNFDFDEVKFNFIGGSVKVGKPGDVNNDDKVNNRDVIALQRFLNEWDIEVAATLCDVTGDGRITNRDSIVLQRYLDEWDVTLY